MADFSPSNLADLPPTTADSLVMGDPRVLGWLREAREDGERINRSDPSYDQIAPAMSYIVGEQLAADYRKLKYLPQVVINESRKAMQAHVSTLTDLKPLFGWKTLNPAYQRQCDLLNQYAVAEWVTTMADLDLGDTVKICLAAGTGDLVVDWDPHAPLGGQHQFTARDPRDTLPIRPSQHRSPQLWDGVVLREMHTVNALKGMYPGAGSYLRASADSVLTTIMGRFRTIASRILTPADPLDALGQAGVHTRQAYSGSIVTYRTFLHDRSRNLTGKALYFGTPGSNFGYVVQPNEPCYPRGRLIVSTDTLVLYDGPNVYWHGLFPICRLRLWSLPWQFLGIPLFNDLLPVQDAINDTVNDLRLGIKQWMDPDIVYNRNAVSESTMRMLDNRRPGKRLKVNPAMGEPYQRLDGPQPQVLALASELWDKLTTKHNDLSGTANLAALLQLRQLPAADTIEKYYEALTPEIRQEARQVEAFMRDLSEMTKTNYFQFLSQTKRRMVLGSDAVTLQDFDMDPGRLIPALRPGEKGYTPELDVNLTTADQRGQFFAKQFVFVVAPNSILALNSTERKMMAFQQIRMGLLDFWTYHEIMETANVGAPPAIPLPPLEPLDEATTLLVMQQTLVQQQQLAINNPGAAVMGGSTGQPQPVQTPDGRAFIMDPLSGQILELRVPTTITERLVAMQQMGIGLTVSAAGRKSSGEAPPKSETKSDGRQTVTESSK